MYLFYIDELLFYKEDGIHYLYNEREIIDRLHMLFQKDRL